MIRHLQLLFFVLLAWPGWTQTASTSPPAIETVEKVAGPFELSGRKFSVGLEVKRVRDTAPTGADFDETVTAVRIRDESGKVSYQKSFPYEFDGKQFSETLSVAAERLAGKNGVGLLITYGFLPSAPLSGNSWQLFGLVSGKLVPFGKPISTNGDLLEPEIAWDNTLQADILNFRVWTGNFFVIVPLRVHWRTGKITPAWSCWKMTPSGPKAICRFAVQAERHPADDLTFVRLFPGASEEGIAAHVVVKKDSTVEFIAADAELRWEETANDVGLGVSDDVWLHVRIDGREGWIHTQEDLQAIGLPMAG